MTYSRTGLALHTKGRERLNELCKAVDLGVSPFIECVIFALTEDEAKNLVATGRKARDQALDVEKSLRKAVKARVSKMDTAELQKVLGG